MDIAKYVERKAVKAGGMEHLARETGVSRPMLYRLRGGEGNPTLQILIKLGLRVVEAKGKP